MAAVTAVALSSCSKDEVTTSVNDNQAISFDAYAGVSAKGLVTDNGTASSSTTASIKDGFGVLGYYQTVTGVASVATFNTTSSTPNYMWNQKVTYETSSWTYSPTKYWPNNTNDRLSFMAYAPYQALVDGDASSGDTGVTIPSASTQGTPTIKLSLLDAAKMVDLVADMQYDLAQGNSTGTANPSTVSFMFEHLLTRVAFEVVLGGDVVSSVATGTKVFLTQVKLVGTNSSLYDKDGDNRKSTKLYSDGTFTFSASADVETNGLGTWGSLTASTTDINLDGKTPGTNNIVNFTDGSGTIPSSTPTQGGTAYTIPRSMELTSLTTATTMFITNHYLFLLPPNGTTGLETAGDVKVYLEYDVVTEDANLYDGHSVVTNYSIVDLPAAHLAKGSAYKYTFTVGLQKVEVEGNIETNWGNETTGSADVEIEDAITTSMVK